MADAMEKSQIATADESYGHVVNGIIFPPGVVSSQEGVAKGAYSALPEKKKNLAISNAFCIQHPETSKRSIYANEGPVDRADYVERERELLDVISEKISEIFRVQNELSERETAHERKTRMLEQALVERSDQLEGKGKEGRVARKKEEFGLNDYKAMMERKLLAADTGAVEAEEKLRKRTENDRSEEADRQWRPSALDRLGVLRKEKRREAQSAKFNSEKLSERMLALTVEIVLMRAEIAMVLGKRLAMGEHGKYASELAAELDFEPLSERCKFFEDTALMSGSCRR